MSSSDSTTTPTMELYDIAMRPGMGSCAVNPLKARLALGFKALPFTTRWVSLPDIPKVRRELDVPPCRNFADGSDYYTLPVLVDNATGAKVGDSFDIALYLQRTYPDAGEGDLFPEQTLDFSYDTRLPQQGAPPLSEASADATAEQPAYANFNRCVDAVFSAHVGLMGYNMPLDDEGRAATLRRIGLESWDALKLEGEARTKLKEAFRAALGDLAKMYERDASGPFLLGNRASHADIVVGGWLYMWRVTVPEEEWEEARGWHGGVFGNLFDALAKYLQADK